MPTNKNGEALMEIENCFRVGNIRNWTNGKILKPGQKSSIPNPISIDYIPLREYRGLPREFKDTCIPIMSKRLCEALTTAGVDNIEYYPVLLNNVETGEVYDYFAYKIIGLVSAASIEESEFETYEDDQPLIDTSIIKLVIDKKKAHDFLLFRLAEKTSTIIVHENIKNEIENNGIDTIKFIKPEEYVHL